MLKSVTQAAYVAHRADDITPFLDAALATP
jgi:hypothetical protein